MDEKKRERSIKSVGADIVGKKRRKKPSAKSSLSDDVKARAKARKFTVINGGKSRNKMIKKLVLSGIILLIVIAIVLLFVLPPTGLGEMIKTRFALRTGGDGYPISADDFSPVRAYSASGSLVVLTDTEIRSYSSSGGLIYSRVHGMASPCVATSAYRTLTFDRGSTIYRVDSLPGEILTGKSDNQIINGDIADNGSFVLSTLSGNETSLVTAFDKNGKEIYKFHSADYYVAVTAISDDGKYVGMCSYNANSAALSSDISIYSTASGDKVTQYSLPDETVYSMNFCGGVLNCITNGRFLSLDLRSNHNDYVYDSKALVKFERLDNGNTLLCLSGAANSSNNEIIILNSHSDEVTSFEIKTTVEHICASNDRVFVVSDGVYAYNYQGEQESADNADITVVDTVSTFGSLAVIYTSGIKLFY